MAEDYKDFVDFVINNYKDAVKIVEVGVGSRSEVLEELDKELNAQVVGTDIKPNDPGILVDDITNPCFEICASAFISRPSTVISTRLGAAGKS